MDQVGPEEQAHAKRKRISLVPKACKSCKTRKIRCDRKIPCSNCRTAGIDCQKVEEAPEKRSKTAQSNDLEEYVKGMESRLRVIEAKLNNQNSTTRRNETQQHTSRPETNRVVSVSETPAVIYEGESSFTIQSLGARETAESMANPRNSGAGADFDIHTAFNSLSGLLQPATGNDQVSENSHLESVEIPLPLPMNLVVTILRRFKEKTPLFLSSYPINDPGLLERICQKVYFPTRPVSSGDVAAMHGVLYWLMKEYLSWNDDFCQRFNLETHLKACKSSFEAGLRSHSVLTVPSFENVIALVMGILKAQDESNPLMGCHLISTAARHCQMLGYHRESTYRNPKEEDANNKRRVFWTLYVFDKTMSLLLGRASYIQDFDVDVKTPAISSDAAIRPWDEAFYWMIKLAEIQGSTYNNLYSASALKRTSSERLGDIHCLKLALEECQQGRMKIDYSKVNEPGIFELSSKTWQVLHYSVLTSILRASKSTNGGEIGSECFKAARLCLLNHLECFPGYTEGDFFTVADFANWVQLYSSFTPFIVIFLHSIAATSMEDVKLLDDVVQTLHRTRSVSKTSERLYSISANFTCVARGLVEARKSCVGRYDEERDALEFLDHSENGHLLFSSSQPDNFSVDMMDYITYPEAQDMSALLECWDSGQPSAMDLLGVNFGSIE